MPNAPSAARAALALAIVVLAACTAASPASVTPATPSPVPASGGRPASGPPAESPSPEPAPAGSLEPAEWVRIPSAAFDGARLEAVIAMPGGFVAVGCRIEAAEGGGADCGAPSAWLSRDATSWGPRVDLPLGLREERGVARTAAAGPAGLVIGGQASAGDEIDAAFWYSADFASFDRITPDPSFDRASVASVRVTGNRFVAVGSGAFTEAAGFHGWSSDDGRTWRAAEIDQSEAFPTGVLPLDDGGALAWGPSCGVCIPETAWWSSPDGARWSADGVSPGLEGGLLETLVVTELGLLAAGATIGADLPTEPAAWERASGDDRWTRSELPPLPSGTFPRDLLAVGRGQVLTATTPRGGTFATLVLGRAPGDDAWHGLAELPDVSAVDVVRHPAEPARLVVMGHAGQDAGGPVASWSGGVDWAP